MEKILFDTDIGSDIDDAVCLAYLLSQPECRLLGITTVSGEPRKRAMLADALCEVAGKAIPIVPGAESPLLIEQKQKIATQAEALRRWPHRTEFSQQPAAEFLRDVIRKCPGEITLLATGPMTNVAALFALDPQIPALLKGLVLMCGRFFAGEPKEPIAEWNAACDPHAAAMVYHAAVKTHRSVGLDVTAQVRMDRQDAVRLFTADILEPVLDFAGIWFRKAEQIVFHDPLAAAVLFNDGICTFQRGTVHVELAVGERLGETRWEPDGIHGKHEIAAQVQVDEFFRHYFSVVK